MPKEDREDAVRSYSLLKKKYPALPALEEIEEEFEIKVYEPVITNIISIMLDRLGQGVNHIEIIFQPARMADMIESKFYGEKQKTEIFNFYKNVISMIHKTVANVYDSREKRIKAIAELFKFYREEYKGFIENFFLEQSRKWMEKEPPEQKDGYFG